MTVITDAEARTIREDFLHWQCRLRQKAMREEGGRPAPGMRPRATRSDGTEIAPDVTVVLVEREPRATTETIRHIVRKTQDPRARYEAGLRFLCADHYQDPWNFSDALTALFPGDSPTAAALAGERRCVLQFEQDGRKYRIPCAVGELAEGEPAFQATYWHNHLFNPEPPPWVRVLSFRPEWPAASTVPPRA